jgi:hypothetical protein
LKLKNHAEEGSVPHIVIYRFIPVAFLLFLKSGTVLLSNPEVYEPEGRLKFGAARRAAPEFDGKIPILQIIAFSKSRGDSFTMEIFDAFFFSLRLSAPAGDFPRLPADSVSAFLKCEAVACGYMRPLRSCADA